MSFPLPFVPKHDYHSGGRCYGANRANGSVITFTDGKKLFVGSSKGDPGAAPDAK